MSETKTRKKTHVGFEFIPVIFANGTDDDIPGLVAAIRNEKFQFDEKIYQPDEPLIIDNRKIRITKRLIVIGNDDNYEDLPNSEEWVIIRQPENERHITITNCLFILG